MIEPTEEDRHWALVEAAKPGGFLPHAKSTADLLKILEREGLVVQEMRPVWNATDAGKAAAGRT